MNEGFFTRKCMVVFAGRPKKSGHNNEVAVRRGSNVKSSVTCC